MHNLKRGCIFACSINCLTSKLTTMTATTFNEIYKRYHKKVFNYVAYKLNGNYLIAEDITSETFIKVNNKLNTFDATKSEIFTWIMTIAINCIADYFRRDKSKYCIRLSDFVDNETGNEFIQLIADNKTDSTIEGKELMREIKMAFESLKPNYKKIANLYFLEELQYNEIAEICNIPMGTVKGTINRCREILQKQLNGVKAEYHIS